MPRDHDSSKRPPRPTGFPSPEDEAPMAGPDGQPLLDEEGNPITAPPHPQGPYTGRVKRRFERLPNGELHEIVEVQDPDTGR